MTLSGEQLAKFIEKHLSELPEKSRKSYETLLDEKDLAKNIAKLIKVMTVLIDCKKKHQILSSSLLEKKQKTMV
jgi:succinate dehydrogenase flavin-adding protein (antitoxin of CptAB toxin-antitoxin module)